MKYAPLLPNETLRKARFLTDPVAHKVIDVILADGVARIDDLFNQLTRNRNLDDVDLPPVVRAYFEEQSAFPAWTDPELVNIGQDVFRRYGIEISILLNYLSLPTAYACPKGAKVLFSTTRLTDRDGDIDRLVYRLMETAQFVMDVMQPGAFEKDGNGIEVALKIRLIHASIRHYLLVRGQWDVKENFEPLNQEHQAGTLQSFSSMILHGLLQMGVKLTPREQEGYYHCWRVVGHFLGVLPELAPPTYEEGLRLGFQILDDQKGKSMEGQALMDSLVDFILKLEPVHFLGRYLPILMIRYFVQDNIGEVLSFGKVPVFWGRFFHLIFRFLVWLTGLFGQRHYFVKRRVDSMKYSVLQKMLDHFNQHKKVWFDVPPSLRGDWNIDPTGRIVGNKKS